MKMKSVIVTAAVAAALGAMSATAMSQSIDGADGLVVAQAAQPRTPDGSAGQRQGAPARRFALPSERVEARLAYAKTALKITDAQQPQWDTFANVLRKHARSMDQRFQQRRAQFEAARASRDAGQTARQPDARSVNAIERLERTQQRMTERSARLNEVIAAAKPLYASFSPEQKQIADGMLANRGRGGHREHHRGMHRGPSA
jgi:LTXXQ motif family protein